jgi:peptidyl-tRNA hydrolase
MPPPAYLLQDFHSSDLDIVSQMLDTTSNAVLTYVTEGLNKAMNVYNGAIDK